MAECQEVIDRLVAVEAELGGTDVLSGTIRMTVPVDMPKLVLARALTSFADQNPSIQIEGIVTDETLDLVAGNIDLALRGGAPGGPGLVARTLGEGQLTLFASPQYASEKIPRDGLGTLKGHIVFDPTNQGGDALTAGARMGAIETRNFELTKALAIRSQGIALLPESLCDEQVLAGQLTKVKFEKELPRLTVYVVMSTRRHMPARVRAFIDFLISTQKKSSLA